MALDSLVALVLDRFTAAETARKPLEEVWFECYRLYRAYTEPLDEENEDLANIFVPKIFADIEAITPRIVMAMLSRRPWVRVMPREKDDTTRAKIATKLLQAQFDRQQMFVKQVNFVKQALIYGTSVGQIGWREEKRIQKVRVYRDRIVGGFNLTQLMGFPQVPVDEEQVIVDWDDPWFEPLDIWDFYPDPDGKTIDEMGWVIRREWVSREDMERAGVYDNISEAARTALGANEQRPSEERLGSVGLGPGQPLHIRTRPIELLHMWTNDQVVVVANRAVVVRNEPNPFNHGRKPFVAIVDTPVPHEFWGIGTAQVLKDLQHELNTIRNQRRDNVTLALYKMFIASKHAGINPNEVVWRPGGIIWVDDVTDVRNLIQPIEVQDVTRSSYAEEQQVHKDMQEVSGVSDFFRGAMVETSRTATEIQQAAIGGGLRVDIRVRLMAEMGLKEIARHFLDLNRQFLTTERVVRFVGERGREEWVRVAPGDLQFPYDDLIPAVANIESWANLLQQREDMLRWVQIFGRAPQLLQMVNWRKFAELVTETFSFADPEELLIPEEQAQALQAAMSQAMLPAVGMNTGNASTAALQGLFGMQAMREAASGGGARSDAIGGAAAGPAGLA